MPPPAITPHIPQPANILAHPPLRVVLDRHAGELGGELHDCARGDVADARERVDAEFGEEAGGGVRAEGVEGLEGCLDELGFGEVDA